MHISTKLQINFWLISALPSSIFLFLSFQNWRPHVRDSGNESFYLGRAFIIHCALSVDCYFRPELQLINLRKALVISHFMKHYCLSTAVLWWQNTLMLDAVQNCVLIFVCIQVFILLTSLKVLCYRSHACDFVWKCLLVFLLYTEFRAEQT